MSEIIVSVVMPVYNEEKYIDSCIKSLLEQDYPTEKMEWIFVDGCSKDKTVAILEEYKLRYPKLIKVFNNPKRIIPYAMNIGIANSEGKYIVRLDAHAEYSKDYISKCVYCLDTTGAQNVGGFLETKSKGFVGGTIAKMLSSKFGVGNSQFRINGKGGDVDTVPFGAFRREVFSQHGGFDERLARGEDNEINYRIRKVGGRVFMSSEIQSTYYCRDSVKGILKQAYQNGLWNVITMRLCPGSMGIRHFIPLAFVLSILGLIGLGFIHWIFWVFLAVEMIMYLALDALFSIKVSETFKEFLLLSFLFLLFHVSYGIGSICGIFKIFSKKYRKSDYCPPKI